MARRNDKNGNSGLPVVLILLHSERPILHAILAFLSAIGLIYPSSTRAIFYLIGMQGITKRIETLIAGNGRYCKTHEPSSGSIYRFHRLTCIFFSCHNWGVVGWCDGAGLTSSAGASYNFDNSRAWAYCACSRCGWGWFGHFNSHLSFLLFLPLFGRRLDID